MIGQDAALLQHIWQEDARSHLSFFCEYASQGLWQPAKHLLALCDELEAAERGDVKRLMVEMPPRYGKSETVSRFFPAWYLGRNPNREIILASYGGDLAFDLSRDARRNFSEWIPALWGYGLRKDSKRVERWEIAGYRGGFQAAGVGGSITGRGADLFIIDDPFKNAEEANSGTFRRRIWDWYRTVARTRLAPGGVMVLVQTRWHADDLAGRLMEEMAKGGEAWKILQFSALAENQDVLGREWGAPLWPERYGKDELLGIKRLLGTYYFNALYQQHPSPPEGRQFKRNSFHYFEVQGEFYAVHRPGETSQVPRQDCAVFQTCDPALSKKDSADYFVLSTWAVTPRRDLLLLDVLRLRLEGPDQPVLFKDSYLRWRPVVQAVESHGLGLALYQQLVRTGLPVQELKAETDKVMRSAAMAARYEAGTVFHLLNAVWLGDWESELLTFPTGEHDDQVDTASYAAILLASLGAQEDTATAVYYDPVAISPI